MLQHGLKLENTLSEMSDTNRTNFVGSHLHKISRIWTFIETEIEVTRVQEKGEWGIIA